MSTMAWDLSDLIDGAARIDAAADQVRGVAGTITALDPAAYGTLVANGAATTEPATSNAHRRLLYAIGGASGAVAHSLREAARLYRETEEANVALADSIRAALGEN